MQTAAELEHNTGERPVLVLVHHFGGSARTWQPVIECIGEQRRCVALDLPGFGREAGHPGPFTVAAMADHVARRILELGLDAYALVGHSMGGKVASALAARRPTGLQSLILLAPSPPSAEPISNEQRETLLAAWGTRSALVDIVDTVTVQTLSASVRATLIEDMLGVARQAWHSWLISGSREDITGSMAQLNIPVLVLSGDGDTAIPTAVIKAEVLPRVPNAMLSVIAGAGHLLNIEAPAEASHLILQAAMPMRSLSDHCGSPCSAMVADTHDPQIPSKTG